MTMDQTKETKSMRKARVAETANGTLWKTRVVRDRTKYSRKQKHKKSIAEAMDFAFMAARHINSFA